METGEIIDNYVLTTHYVDDKGNVVENEIPEDYKEGWGGSRSFYNPVFDFETNDWIEAKDQNEILEISKEKRFAELSTDCQNAILGYFKATIDEVEYEFSFDREAQANFTGTMNFFGHGIIDSVEWTAWRGEEASRIKLNRDQFYYVVGVAFAHKNEKISRLRNVLQPILSECQSVEEINNVIW